MNDFMPINRASVFLIIALVCSSVFFYLADVQAQSVVDEMPMHQLNNGQSGPTLTLRNDLTTTAGGVIVEPLSYQSNGVTLSAVSFSLDLDQACLAFDPGDQNRDGLPDALTFYTPLGFTIMVTVDLLDADSEVDMIIADLFPPFTALPDRAPLLELQLQAVCQPAPGTTSRGMVAFSAASPPSFSSLAGTSITGNTVDGWVTIAGPVPTATPLPTATTVVPATVTPAITPPGTRLPPATPTLIATSPATTPTVVPSPATLLDYFAAMPAANVLRLQWRTVREVQTNGFYLYRKQVAGLARNGDFALISPLLPTQGDQGGTYSFVDTTVLTDARYLYLLVEEKQNGLRTEFIEFMAIGQLTQEPHRAWLPLVAHHGD